MKNVKITQQEINRIFAWEARRVGLKPSELPRPKVDCGYINRVCRNLRIYRVYAVHLFGYFDPISGMPEVYFGKTRMEISDRVRKFISHINRNHRYRDLYYNIDFDVLYGGLTDDEARAIEKMVIKTIQESQIWFPLNKSEGGEPGRGRVEYVFLDAIINKYIGNIRNDIAIYRLYGADFDIARVLLPHEVVDVSIKEILKKPRRFKDIHFCINEVAQQWESENANIAPKRSNGEPRREISKIIGNSQAPPKVRDALLPTLRL